MTPNTTVTLYATDFDISNRYVVAVESQAEALAAVSAYPSKTFENCYWQRTDSFVFRCNGNINDIEQYNYCVFINNGRYNFAFITKCQYVNDAMTWVYLEIDPWLNFAGQYVFHDSSMKRCHPTKARDESLMLDDIEPIAIDRWVPHATQTFGNASEYGVYKVHLMTTIDPTYIPFQGTPYWQAVGDLMTGNGAAIAAIIDSTQRYARSTVILGFHPQAATSIVAAGELSTLITSMCRNGVSDYILGAYYVPPSCMYDPSLTGFQLNLNPTLTNRYLQAATKNVWCKMDFSPQFKRIWCNLCGKTLFYPVEEIRRGYLYGSGNPIEFNIGCDPSFHGCIHVWMDNNALPTSDRYPFHSQEWDRVQLTGYGANVDALALSGINQGRILTNGISNIAGAAASMLNPLNMFKAANIAVDAISDAANMVLDSASNAVNQLQIYKSGGYASGESTSSMVSYNINYPLVKIGIDVPETTTEIQKMFGTYGYTMNGKVEPIVFKSLPYWNYYECQNASITGQQVPQKYLAQVISMFNRGIFVFKDVTNFKDFSKAYDNHY